MPLRLRWLAWLGVSFILAAGGTSAMAETFPKDKFSRQSIRSRWDFQTDDQAGFKSAWVPVSGKWSLLAEPDHPANRVLKQGEIKRSHSRLASQDAYANFYFSVRMRTEATQHPTRNWQTGVLFRWTTPHDYYKLRITAANIALSRAWPEAEANSPNALAPRQKASATREEMLMSLPLGAVPNQWHTLTVACKGERITVGLDGRDVRTLTDPGLGQGKIGLFAFKTQAYFDDLFLDYEKPPQFSEGLKLTTTTFRILEDRELMIYYRNPQPGPVSLQVLDPAGQPFALLTRDVHDQGLNSITWDGQGMAGQRPRSGLYTLELKILEKRHTKSIQVQL